MNRRRITLLSILVSLWAAAPLAGQARPLTNSTPITATQAAKTNAPKTALELLDARVDALERAQMETWYQHHELEARINAVRATGKEPVQAIAHQAKLSDRAAVLWSQLAALDLQRVALAPDTSVSDRARVRRAAVDKAISFGRPKK